MREFSIKRIKKQIAYAYILQKKKIDVLFCSRSLSIEMCKVMIHKYTVSLPNQFETVVSIKHHDQQSQKISNEQKIKK